MLPRKPDDVKKPEVPPGLVQVNFSSKFIASANKAEKTKTRKTKREFPPQHDRPGSR